MTKWLNYVEEIIVVFSLVVMSIIAFVNVLSRNFFDLSLAFSEEVTVNLFVFLTFVGTSIGVRKNAHLGFSLLFDKSPPFLKRFLVLFVGALTTLLFLVITYYGYVMIQFQIDLGTTTPAMGWPQWLFSIGPPLGTLLCTIRSIEATVKEWKEVTSEQEGTE